MVTSPQYDGRFIGRYTQQWFTRPTARGSTVISTWDRMGYDPPATTAPSNGATSTGRSARTSST